MYIVTNRNVDETAGGMDKLGSRINPQGPNELRLVEAVKKKASWSLVVLPDIISDKMKEEVGLAGGNNTYYASDYVARKIFEKVQELKRNVLFLVHGYNNDIEAVLERAEQLEALYKVEVLIFYWPANGGGVVGGASYLSDKRDARASAGALDRCIGRMAELFAEITHGQQEKIKAKVDKDLKGSRNLERRNQRLVALQERKCPFSVNMAIHSMGAYVYQYALIPKSSEAGVLLFDNVVLLSADVNNEGHEKWVDNISCRKSVYVTINENDQALRLSRAKIGDEQLPRLGHYRHNLVSKQANYVDFTDYKKVGSEHAYFVGKSVANHASPIFLFFEKVFNGGSAYDLLSYDTGLGAYRFK